MNIGTIIWHIKRLSPISIYKRYKFNKWLIEVIENEESYRQAIFDQWTRKEIPSSIQLFSVKEEAFHWLARY